MHAAVVPPVRRLVAVLVAVPLALVGLVLPTTGSAHGDSAALAHAASAADWVEAIQWSRFQLPPPSDQNADRSRRILLNSNKYAMTTWWTAKYGSQTGQYLDFGGNAEARIRPPAAEAIALATALVTGVYDPAFTGVSAEQAKQRAVRLTVSLAYRHRANSAGGWGNAWQSALWAYYAGHAGWLLWDDLSIADRERVANMLEYEADRFLDYAVPYYQDRDGNVVYAGDSKAEENAWNANLLQLVTAMMPNHPHQAQWMSKNLELMVSAFARPSDLDSDEVTHGRKIRDWLNGSNILENGTLYNHGFIHPDYMATVAMNAAAPLTYGLAQMPTPKAAMFNADVVYAALTTVDFASPLYRSPGGTMYTKDAAGNPTEAIYYPSGNDWGTHRRMHFAALDAQAHLFGYDTTGSPGAAAWERAHSDKVLEMQARGTDGRTYQTPSEDTYSGREEWVALAAAQQYLAHWLVAQQAVRITNQPYWVLAVATTSPDLLVAGETGNVDLTLKSSTSVPAMNVSMTVEAPAGWTVTAQGATSWKTIDHYGESARLAVTAPASQPPGDSTLTVRITYHQAPGQHAQERVERVVIPVVPPPPAGEVWLSDVAWFAASNGYSTIHKDTNLYGATLQVEGTQYAKGLWTHAPASISYYLGGSCTRFTGEVGIDDSMDVYQLGTVVFQVWANDTKVYDSGLVNGETPAKVIDVPLTGVRTLRLVVTDGGNGKQGDHAVWGGARMTCG